MLTKEWKHEAPVFHKCLDELSCHFFLPDELIHENRDQEIGLLMEDVSCCRKETLASYAVCMNGRQVENHLFALLDSNCSGQAERLAELLSMRMSRRVVVLIWSFYAYCYENENIGLAIKPALKYIRESGLDIPQARMLETVELCEPARSVELLANLIREEGLSLNTFFRNNEISPESPLAVSVARKTLIACGATGFAINEGWLLRLIRDDKAGREVLENYISAVEEKDYSLAVNELIIEKMGRPVNADDWPGFSAFHKQKFLRWCFLKELRDFFSCSDYKLDFFARYLPWFKEVETMGGQDADGIFSIDFGKFVILDTQSGADYSFLCEKTAFERMRRENLFNADSLMLPEAREYILEDAREEVVRLNFHQIGKLYAKEMLDILLDIIPDVKYVKSLLASKRNLKQLIADYQNN